QLSAAGLVVEDFSAGGGGQGSPGRPSPMVHVRPDSAVELSLEIAVDSLATALVGLGGGVLRHLRVEHARAKSSPRELAADLPVNPSGRACGCGSVGCWETEIGVDALLAKAGYPRGGGQPGLELVLRQAAHGSAAEVAAVEDVGRWLGFGLAGLVNVFNPCLV